MFRSEYDIVAGFVMLSLVKFSTVWYNLFSCGLRDMSYICTVSVRMLTLREYNVRIRLWLSEILNWTFLKHLSIHDTSNSLAQR